MKRYISVSVMCSDLMKLGNDISILQKNGVDMLHVDVMDAHFVPNLTFGPDFISAMQKMTSMPLDIHLMVEDPELILSRFSIRTGDIVSVHVETGRDMKRIADKIHSGGGLFGLVLNPETEVSSIEPYLDCLDTVTLMLVHPGYAGAKMVDGIMDKVARMRKFLDSKGYEKILISVDGSVSRDRARHMAEMGAGIFVGGTAGIYRKDLDLPSSIREMRSAISVL
jgi:ribulose-phosphate 3-epimerase